jgi:hypothetical protein
MRAGFYWATLNDRLLSNLLGLLKITCYTVLQNQGKKNYKPTKEICVMTDTAENLYRTQEKRVTDAIEINVPDRVPWTASFVFFPAHCHGCQRKKI